MKCNFYICYANYRSPDKWHRYIKIYNILSYDFLFVNRILDVSTRVNMIMAVCWYEGNVFLGALDLSCLYKVHQHKWVNNAVDDGNSIEMVLWTKPPFLLGKKLVWTRLTKVFNRSITSLDWFLVFFESVSSIDLLFPCFYEDYFCAHQPFRGIYFSSSLAVRCTIDDSIEALGASYATSEWVKYCFFFQYIFCCDLYFARTSLASFIFPIPFRGIIKEWMLKMNTASLWRGERRRRCHQHPAHRSEVWPAKQ